MQSSARVVSEQLRNPNELDVNLRMEFGPFEPEHKWKRLSECLEFVAARRSKHTAVAYKDAIYIFGGDNGKSMLNDLVRFDVLEKSWTRMGGAGKPPAPRYHHSAVVHGSSMFVFGGYTGDILANSNLTNKNDLFEYNFQSASWLQWKFTGQEPVPRSAHGAAVYDDKLWIFAGYDGNARLNDMWTVSLTSENPKWERVEQCGTCPPTCCNFPVAVARGKMYVFSGQSGAKITNALFEFDFESRTWCRIYTEHLLRSAPPAPARRYGHIMAAHGRYLYVFGGAADNTLPADLHQFDLDTQTWSVVPTTAEKEQDPPSGRLFHAGVVMDGALYIFGGTIDNNVRSAELFRLKLSDYPRCTLHDDFGRILRSNQFCDLTLLVGPSQIPITAHQAILAARSQLLRTKIKEAREELEKRIAAGEMKAPDDGVLQLEIKLPEAAPDAFRMLLEYIYTDRIDPTQKTRRATKERSPQVASNYVPWGYEEEDPTKKSKKGSKERHATTPQATSNYVPWNCEEEDNESASLATMELVLKVQSLASRLRVPLLRGLCARFIRANLRPYNVLHALTFSHHYNLSCIKEYCLRFIIKDYNFTPIVMSPEFEQLEQCLMVEIIRRRQAPSKQPHTPNDGHECDTEIVGTTLEQDMAAFVSDIGAQLADIKLRIGPVTRPGHRSILAARAAYFEAMFRSFAPQHNIVNIQIADTIPSERAFDSLLRYIYYGDTNMPTEDSLYLFQAPIYYGFTNNRLQVFCKHNLQSSVTDENVLLILATADRMRVADIKEFALNKIVQHLPEVAYKDAMKSLAQPLLVELIWALAEEEKARRAREKKATPCPAPQPLPQGSSPAHTPV